MRTTPKLQRQKRIRSLLHENPNITITELSAMIRGVDRKTVERDILELVGEGVVIGDGSLPNRYSLKQELEVQLSLTLEQVGLLMDLIGKKPQAAEIKCKVYQALMSMGS